MVGVSSAVLWNSSMTFNRSPMVMDPSRRVQLNPLSVRSGCRMDRRLVNWLTTIDLAEGFELRSLDWKDTTDGHSTDKLEYRVKACYTMFMVTFNRNSLLPKRAEALIH